MTKMNKEKIIKKIKETLIKLQEIDNVICDLQILSNSFGKTRDTCKGNKKLNASKSFQNYFDYLQSNSDVKLLT